MDLSTLTGWQLVAALGIICLTIVGAIWASNRS